MVSRVRGRQRREVGRWVREVSPHGLEGRWREGRRLGERRLQAGGFDARTLALRKNTPLPEAKVGYWNESATHWVRPRVLTK